MCRFVLYLGSEITVGSLVTEPVNSIIHQSFHSHERKEPLNGDGFGLAWYVPEMTEEPALFKDITPAWNNLNLLNLARVTRSSCILAHVRAASPGLPVIQLNCHPFTWGPFSFMHNGRIGGFHEIRRTFLSRLSDRAFDIISGSTDSEHLFALFLDIYWRVADGRDRCEAMADALTETIAAVREITDEAGVDELSLLNLAVTDGQSAAVSRYVSRSSERANSLYLHTGKGYSCDEGRCRMNEAADGGGAVLIASEPLSGDKGWEPVSPNSMIVVRSNQEVEMRPLG
ncbi:MAG: class II glutamine amidotransferase [Thermodesulfobacteriota bacterium]